MKFELKLDKNALNKVAKDVTREWARKAQVVLDDVARTSGGNGDVSGTATRLRSGFRSRGVDVSDDAVNEWSKLIAGGTLPKLNVS